MKKMICPIRIIVNDCIFMSIGKIIHPIKSHSGALVSRQVSSLIRVLAARALMLCKLLCSQFNQEICWVWDVKESLSQRKQVRNSPEIGIE